MYKVEFKNIGRSKANFSTTTDKITHEFLYKQVKPHLLSDCINFADGVVFAGFHKVGEYEIKEE